VSYTDNWRIPIDFEDWMRQIEKRLMSEERRPQVNQASDLLGPGSAPRAVLVNDWNSAEATFVGVFYSTPATGTQNSPNDALYWLGETFGDPDGYGFQRLTQHRVDPPAGGSWDVYQRRFHPVAGQTQFTAWELV
jgi:hypothetical protein